MVVDGRTEFNGRQGRRALDEISRRRYLAQSNMVAGRSIMLPSRLTMNSALQRQPQAGDAPWTIHPILQRQRAAVAFGDLPAQHQPDVRSEERRVGKERRSR